MWSRLFGASDNQDPAVEAEPQENPHLSRVDRCHELAKVTKKILQLQKHDAVLALESRKSGAGTVAYEKHIVTSALSTAINTHINRFNLTPKKSDEISELEDVLILLSKIKEFTHRAHDDDEATLNVHREVDSKRSVLGLATLGIVATAVTAGSFLVFLTGYASLVGAAVIYDGYEKKYLDAHTFKIVTELDAAIDEVTVNIKKYIARHKAPEEIRKTVEQRTWGAIALCANPAANLIPTDVKALIMARILSGYEKEVHVKNLGNLQKGLFKATKQMLDAHPRSAVEHVERTPSPSP